MNNNEMIATFMEMIEVAKGNEAHDVMTFDGDVYTYTCAKERSHGYCARRNEAWLFDFGFRGMKVYLRWNGVEYDFNSWEGEVTCTKNGVGCEEIMFLDAFNAFTESLVNNYEDRD